MTLLPVATPTSNSRNPHPGARLLSEREHSDAVTEVTSLGGAGVLTTSLDATVKVWDVGTLAVHSFGKIHSKGILAACRVR